MRQRCNNPGHKQYVDYGGRGIRICDEWADFESFYQWALSNGYDESLSIDRIDNNKGYCPDNCRWVDGFTQANNKRNNRIITFKGETKPLGQWAVAVGIDANLLRTRLYKGWSVERALSTPHRR